MRLLLFFIFFLFPGFLSGAERCHPSDKTALLKFKNSFANPDQILLSWQPDFDCCDWYGVQCNETTNRVIGLESSVRLNGTIPSVIADLKYLRTLRLRKNPFLIGEIPPAIGKLTNLVSLDLSWNNISGSVPAFLSNLKKLWFLDLSFNKLSGTIPASFSTFPEIIGIDLSRNQLTGSIPESFGHFQGTVPTLVLSHNKLSGEIPASLGNMNFARILISRNNFSGSALMFFKASKTSDTIDISRNNFAFDFSEASFMEQTLVELDISHNKIWGSIPSRITDCVMLQSLNVSYNRLCGKIPSGWKMKYRSEPFDNTSYLHNRCLCSSPLEPCKN